MNFRLKNIIYPFFILFVFHTTSWTQQKEEKAEFINYPKAYNYGDYKFMIGLGITKLPTNIVEEEINTSPSIFADFRIGLPSNFTGDLYFATNYISNIGTLGIQYNLINSGVSLALGAKGSIWFGHVDIESIKLKSNGYLLKPKISFGIDFGSFYMTSSFEIQFGYMRTFSEDSLLAVFSQPKSGYTLRLTIEQPFYKNQWVLLGIGLHYASFYYQSWLSYSTIKQYLLYPELYFGFIL